MESQRLVLEERRQTARMNPVLAFKDDEAAVGDEVKSIAIGTILIVISLVVALTVLPTLTSSVATAQGDANVTATQSTLLGLIPTMVIVALVISGVGFLFKGLKGIRS